MDEENIFMQLTDHKKCMIDIVDSPQKFVNLCIEEVFQIRTRSSSNEKYTLLKHIDCKYLDLHNLQEVILEVLGVYDQRNFNKLTYLKECFMRCSEENPKIKEINYVFVDLKLFRELKEIILKTAVTYMSEPDIFNSASSGNEVLELIVSSFFANSSSMFLKEIRSSLQNNEYAAFFEPALFVIVSSISLHNLCITDPEYYDTVKLIDYFTNEETLANIFICSRTFLPSDIANTKNVGEFVNKTILGLMFNMICTQSRKEHAYFDSSKMSMSDILEGISSVRNSLEVIYNQLVSCIKRLLAHPTFRTSIYIWFNATLEVHEIRSKLASEMMLNRNLPTTHDGFFVNMAHVIFKIFRPIADDYSKLSARVLVDYCRYNHNFIDSRGRKLELSYKDESMLIHSVKDGFDEDKSFNFQTHWFFLTHKMIKIGLIPAYENYGRFCREINDLINNSESSDQNPEYHNIDIDRYKDEHCCLRSQVEDPSILNEAIRFCCASSVFLLDVIGIKWNKLDKFNLLNFQANHENLKYLPEDILDNIASLIMSLLKFDYQSLYRFGYEIHYIFLCFSYFMGSNECITNPHLRAKLANALNFMISIASEDSGYLTFIKAIFLENVSLHQILPSSLFNLFIDIESTGDSNEFQQKFSYRYHMYKILFFIWDMEEYVDSIKDIANRFTDSDQQLHLYLRFINLLINDATYLLDEATSNLMKIRELENELYTDKVKMLKRNEVEEKTTNLEKLRDQTTSLNLLSLDTLKTISMLTKTTQKPFLSSAIVDRIAAMLNYFLKQLVGEKKKDLKVRNMEKISFQPKELVAIICQIYIHLCNDRSFCLAVVEDGRSFSSELPNLALSVLTAIGADPLIIQNFTNLKHILIDVQEHALSNDPDYDDIPDNFLDPISCTLIKDPVKLPASNVTVDRTTITKHLLSNPTDPFCRAPLQVSMLIPLPELKKEIEQWLINRKSK